MGYVCTFSLFKDQLRQGRVGKDIRRDLAKYVIITEASHVAGQFFPFDVCLFSNLFHVHLNIVEYVRHISLDAIEKSCTIMKLEI